MSTKGLYSRAAAVAHVGLATVELVETVDADFTGRAQTDGDPGVEFSASINCRDFDGEPCTLGVYYYQSPEALDSDNDLDELDWIPAGYDIR
jgi:hypothetical protein